MQLYQETANEPTQQDPDIWGVRCLVSRPCPFRRPALACGAKLQVVVALMVPGPRGTAGGLVWRAWSGMMQFPITLELSHLRLGLCAVWVSARIVALVGVGPLGGDSLRVVWPELPFLNVWVVSGLQG